MPSEPERTLTRVIADEASPYCDPVRFSMLTRVSPSAWPPRTGARSQVDSDRRRRVGVIRGVVVVAAVEVVGAVTATKGVVAATAIQGIDTATAPQMVVAASTGEDVDAGIAVEVVAVLRAGEVLDADEGITLRRPAGNDAPSEVDSDPRRRVP